MNRRTTIAAEADAVATFEIEARRRGISLSRVLAELIEREAEALRATRRPTIGFVSGDGSSIAELMERDPDGPFNKPYRDE